MKKTAILLLSILSISGLFAQNSTYKVSGHLEGLEAKTASILQWNGEGTNYHDVTVTDGNKILYEGECSFPMMVRIGHDDEKVLKKTGRGYYPTKTMFIWAVATPGETVTINGKITDFVDSYSNSNAENKALYRIHKEVFPLMNEALNLRLKVELDNTISEDEKKNILKKSGELSDQALTIQKRLIKEDPSSIAALWYLDDMLIRSQITPDEVEAIMKKVAPKYHNHPYYNTVKTKVEGAKGAVVGNIVPDVVSNLTPDGSTFDLKSLRGKFVIIDFWGSWCNPCMMGMPKMREYRDRYKDKLQVVGIANDRNMNVWKSTIESANLNWPHIFSGKDELDFVAKFNVAGYPTKLIIGPDGKILYRGSGESADFYTKLEEFLK